LGHRPTRHNARQLAKEAGFSSLRRAAKTPVNLILELTPWRRRAFKKLAVTHGVKRRKVVTYPSM